MLRPPPPLQRTLIVVGLLLLALLYLIFCVFLGLCRKETGPGPGPEIAVPLSFELIDAETEIRIRASATVTIIDPEGKILLPNRERDTSLTVREGVLPLVLKPEGRALSPGNPYRFRIEVEADKYFSAFESVQLDTLLPVSMVLSLVPKDSSAAQKYAFHRFSSAFMGSEIGPGQPPLVLPFLHKYNDTTRHNDIRITLEGGTSLLDESGAAITNPDSSDNVKLVSELAFFSISQPSSARLFPGGCLVTNLVDRNNRPRATPDSPVFFRPVAWFSLDMAVDDGQSLTKVKKFSPNGAKVIFTLDDLVINPETGEPLAPGDKISLWKLSRDDAQGSQFQHVGDVAVQPSVNSTEVEIGMDSPATWCLGVSGQATCDTPIVIPVNNTLPQGRDRWLDFELANPIFDCGSNPGDPVCDGFPYRSGRILFPGSAVRLVTFNQAPLQTDMVFSVFKYFGHKKQIVARGAEVFTPCNPPPPSGQELIPDSNLTCLKMRVLLNFDNGDDTRKICDNALWYKDLIGAAGKPWNFAGFFIEEEIQTLEIMPRPADGSPPEDQQLRVWFNTETDSYLSFPLTSLVMFGASDNNVTEDGINFRRTVDSNNCIELVVEISDPERFINKDNVHSCRANGSSAKLNEKTDGG